MAAQAQTSSGVGAVMTQTSPQTYDGSIPLKDTRRERFCQEAVTLNDIKAAYELVGFKRARGNAHRLVREPLVSKRLEYLWGESAKLVELLGARHLVAADRIAHANMFDFWDIDPRSGKLKKLNLAKVPRVLGTAIQEISYDAKGRPKVKLHDAAGMLKFLIERQSPVARRLELAGKDGDPVKVVMDWIAANKRRGLPEPDEAEGGQ